MATRLAHDVRTPMSAMLGHLDLILHEPVTDAARHSAEICRGEVERFAAFSDDLLALTAIRAGTARQVRRQAGALAEEAVAVMLPLADQLGATLNVQTPSDQVLVGVADGDLIRALRNLVANSLRHGLGEERRVMVTVEADDEAVTFAVADFGPGVDPAQLGQLCQPFARGDGVSVPGTGLGLAIVAEVLAAHGSSLNVANGEGSGAVFSFVLPRARR